MQTGSGLLLHAQHLSAPLPEQDTEDRRRYEGLLQETAEAIAWADAVVVGAGSGLSTAAGYDFYHPSEWFDEEFAPYEKTGCFSTPMDGLYHLYATNEQRWAFMARFICALAKADPGRVYADLAHVLAGKRRFMLTTNVDGLARLAFVDEELCTFQGDFRGLQCTQPGHDRLYDALSLAKKLVELTDWDAPVPGVPTDLLPRCPLCGRLMRPWIRDDGFLEGSAWHAQVARYEGFVRDALAGGNVLFWEIGVGGMTPSIIEIPFWRMVAGNENARYLRLNPGKASMPEQLRGRAINVVADAACFLHDLALRVQAAAR